MTFDLVVAGKLAIDELSFKGIEAKPVLGGSAAHVALAAATMGRKVAIVSAIGDDFPQRFIRVLESKNIDLSGVIHRQGRSSHFWADFASNGTMTNYNLHFGVGNQLSFRHFTRLLKQTRAIHLGILPPYLLRALIQRAYRKGPILSMTTIFHQAQRLRDKIVPQLPYLDILFLNAKEATYLTGTADSTEAIKQLGIQVPLVVVTQGPNGCMVFHEKKIQHIDSYSVQEIDATGAGDSFAGAFLASYLNDKDIVQAATWGNAAGAFNVQDLGCTNLAKATRQDLERLVFSQHRVTTK
ncbi:MAG: carbohydrate kinase family protein [Promethearchaeota archaeon]